MMKRNGLVTGALLMLLAGSFSAACSKKQDEPLPAGKASTIALAGVSASPETCQACLANTQCGELPSCTNFAGEDRAACEAVEQCIQTSNCADGKETFTSCFCGTLKTSDCIAAPQSGAGAPAGACTAVIRKSLGGDAPTNREILARFTKGRYPGGAAIGRMNCSKFKGCGPQCGF